MKTILFSIFCLAWYCGFCQNQLEGQWIITNSEENLKNHLCIFKGSEILFEQEEFAFSGTYKLNLDTLIIHERAAGTQYFKLQIQTKDSITLLPISWRYPLKLVRRKLRYELIDFDSIVYSEKNPPIYSTPAIEIISKLKTDGRASFFRHETDTVKQLDLNRRRIIYSDDDGHDINSSGFISAENLLELKTLLNDSNIKNINVERDFEPYVLNTYDSPPSTLAIYKNGLVTYRVTTIIYPLTLAPVVAFMLELAHKIQKRQN